MSRRHRDQDDTSLRGLVRLTRESLTGADDGTDLDESGLAHLREVRAARVSWHRRVAWLLALGVGAAAGGTLIGWRIRAPAPLTFEVVEDDATAGGTPSDAATARIIFSDGSEIGLDPGARAAVRDLRPDGARIVLAGGRARASFAPRAAGRWQLDAGPYVVEVGAEPAGTAFDTAWSHDDQSLEVWQRSGSVRVRGPLIDNGMALTPGQHLGTRLTDDRIVLDSPGRSLAP